MLQEISINLSELDKKYLIENDYKYALVYYLNDIILDKIENLDEIDKDILVEAMFFSEDKQLHFFEDNDYRGILIQREKEDEIIEEKYITKERLGKRLKINKYNKIKVANYIGYENDGQAYIKATCLCKLEEV